ncbi:MAG: mannitol dehydrogenase family protein [Solirubrobacteraceae bacterium]
MTTAERHPAAVALSRAALAAADDTRTQTPPARIVHIGLGVFHRAHQAWYTDRAHDRAQWGIAAFTGRDPQAALLLSAQEGLYTLIERGADRDSATVIASIVEARDGADLERFLALLASPSTALVTTTVTEAGYRLDPDGQPNAADPVLAADLRAISAALGRAELLAPDGGVPQSALGRLLLGFEARRRAGGGPIALVPCDNVPSNGTFVARGLHAMAARTNDELAAWIDRSVSFVSTSVDRITPKSTPADLATATELTGWRDRATVVTEPFRDWVLSGEFPAGRPAWESAGARFVADIEPFERRKLWLLNGAHSLLAYVGLHRGHDTVAQAMADRVCLEWVNEYWDEAARHLPLAELDIDAYRGALVERFENPRIEYQLRQIATDGVAKLRVRVAPVVIAERAAGADAQASIRAIATWVLLILGGAAFDDTEADAVAVAARSPRAAAVRALLELVQPRLVEDPHVIGSVLEIAAQ